MIRLITLLSALPLLVANGQVTSVGGHRSVASTCTTPAFTTQYTFWNSTNTCNGGGACTVGTDGIDSISSTGSITGRPLVQATSAQRPLYTPAALNGLAVGTFTQAAQTQIGGQELYGSATNGNFAQTFLVVMKMSASSGGGNMIGANPTGSNLEWYVSPNATSGFNKASTIIIGTSTGTFATSTWYAMVLQFNQPTGVWSILHCASGSCVSDGTGTNLQGFGWPVQTIGFQNNGDGGFGGQIAEVSFFNGISTTGFASYVQCKYGI
jgi:hypothetical protein